MAFCPDTVCLHVDKVYFNMANYVTDSAALGSCCLLVGLMTSKVAQERKEDGNVNARIQLYHTSPTVRYLALTSGPLELNQYACSLQALLARINVKICEHVKWVAAWLVGF